MRKLLLLALAILHAVPVRAQVVRVIDDPRAEVLGLLFRMAGAPEFSEGTIQPYLREADSTFAPFRNHPVFGEINRLRRENGLALSAVLSMAPQLTDPVTFGERVPLDSPSSRLSRQWHGAEARTFLREARDFAAVAPVAAFLAAHRDVFDSSSVRMQRMIGARAHLDWLPRFFGDTTPALFIVSPMLVNARGNFAAEFAAGPMLEHYAYMGTAVADSLGFPVPSASELPIVVHEFAHAFVNPVVGSDPRLRASGEVIFRAMAGEMRAQGYGSAATMLNESLVRAVVIRHRAANEGAAAAAREAITQRGLGFTWIDGLAALLAEYEASRDRYPGFPSFVPRIAAYYDSLAPHIDAMRRDFEARRPRVTSTSIPEGAAVSPALAGITVHFDVPVDTIFHLVGRFGPDIPELTSVSLDSAHTTLTLGMALRPGQAYTLPLGPGALAGVNGEPLRAFVLHFSTSTASAAPPPPRLERSRY